MNDTSLPHSQLSAHHIAGLMKSGARHKYDYGHAVIVSGPAGQGGAARLAARAALRVGAGLVSVATGRDSLTEHAAHLNAVMIKPFDDLETLKTSAICIGPNLGLDDAAFAKLSTVLALPVPVVLDADAITLVSRHPDLHARAVGPNTILTPHDGELRRLIPDAFDQTDNRETRAKIAAETTGCIILSKGVETHVARPDGTCTTIDSARFSHAAWLATAGSGDVLAGIITGLLARGFDGFDAATVGAVLHLHCAQILGPGLIADDLPEAMPRVLQMLHAAQTTPPHLP